MLRALSEGLSAGSRLEFVTPIGQKVEAFLNRTAELVGTGFFRGGSWWLEQTEAGEPLCSLAELAESEGLKRLAVYLNAYDSEGYPLFEAEDGNDYLFLGDRLPGSALAKILEVLGTVDDGESSISLVQPRGTAF